jgi:hypothetical protein
MVTAVGGASHERHAGGRQDAQVAVNRPTAHAKAPRQVVHTIAGLLKEPQALNHANEAGIHTPRGRRGQGVPLSPVRLDCAMTGGAAKPPVCPR